MKKNIISIPAHIILNEAGVSFFAKHDRPLCSFEDSDGSDRFGFVTKTIDFAWLKKMLLKGFVEKIELEIQEIARSNELLSDVVRLVFFSMFRHRITLTVLDNIYNSPMLRSWNRANPKRSMGPGVHISKEIIKTVLKQFEIPVEEIKRRLHKIISDNLKHSKKKWDGEEKLTLFIDEMIQELDPLMFFILVGSQEDDRRTLMNDIASQILSIINMIDIFDMTSLLCVELASTSERSALVRVKKHQKNAEIFRDIYKAKSSVNEERFRGTTVVISIPRYESNSKNRLKFRFSFYNDAADANAERRLMENFSERNNRFSLGKSHEDLFYNDDFLSDNTMRFYYSTLLFKLCEMNNILMDLKVKESWTDSRTSVTTLSFRL